MNRSNLYFILYIGPWHLLNYGVLICKARSPTFIFIFIFLRIIVSHQLKGTLSFGHFMCKVILSLYMFGRLQK